MRINTGFSAEGAIQTTDIALMNFELSQQKRNRTAMLTFLNLSSRCSELAETDMTACLSETKNFLDRKCGFF